MVIESKVNEEINRNKSPNNASFVCEQSLEESSQKVHELLIISVAFGSLLMIFLLWLPGDLLKKSPWTMSRVFIYNKRYNFSHHSLR